MRRVGASIGEWHVVFNQWAVNSCGLDNPDDAGVLLFLSIAVEVHPIGTIVGYNGQDRQNKEEFRKRVGSKIISIPFETDDECKALGALGRGFINISKDSWTVGSWIDQGHVSGAGAYTLRLCGTRRHGPRLFSSAFQLFEWKSLRPLEIPTELLFDCGSQSNSRNRCDFTGVTKRPAKLALVGSFRNQESRPSLPDQFLTHGSESGITPYGTTMFA